MILRRGHPLALYLNQARVIFGWFSPLVFKFKANSNDTNSFIRVHFFL